MRTNCIEPFVIQQQASNPSDIGVAPPAAFEHADWHVDCLPTQVFKLVTVVTLFQMERVITYTESRTPLTVPTTWFSGQQQLRLSGKSKSLYSMAACSLPLSRQISSLCWCINAAWQAIYAWLSSLSTACGHLLLRVNYQGEKLLVTAIPPRACKLLPDSTTRKSSFPKSTKEEAAGMKESVQPGNLIIIMNSTKATKKGTIMKVNKTTATCISHRVWVFCCQLP